MRRQGVVSVVAAVALGLAAATPARAEVSTYSTGRYNVGAPAVAGDGIGWIEPIRSGYRLRRRSGGQTTTVREVHRPRVTAQLVGSPDGLLVQESAVLPGSHGMLDVLLDDATFSQSPAGTASFVQRGAGCLFRSTYWCGLNSDIDGPNAVAPAPGDPGGMQVVSLVAGTVRRLPEGAASPMAIAGSNVAWVALGGREAIVYDWAAGRELYRVPVPPGAERYPYGPSGVVDVRGDGTVLIGYPAIVKRGRRLESVTRYGWASPAEPSFHPARFTTTISSARPQFHGDDVLLTGFLRTTVDRPFSAYLTTLRGTPRRLLTGVAGSATVAGDRLLWNERTCAGTRIAGAPLAELERHPLNRTARCRLRLAGPARVDRRGHLILDLDCAGLARSCGSDTYVLSATATRRYGRGARALRRNAPVLVDVDRNGGSGNRLKFKLTRAARTQLRRNGSLRIALRATVSGYERPRATTLTVRAP